nr:MAG TPA: hypothetical protein [Caudoviricetes sp.]
MKETPEESSERKIKYHTSLYSPSLGRVEGL